MDTDRKDKKALAVFEREILRNIFASVQVNGAWGRRTNTEL